MKTRFAVLGILIWLVQAGWPQASPGPQPAGAGGTERIGVYDSRAVAVAFNGSAIQELEMREVREEYQTAQAAGDTALVSQLEAAALARQAKLRQQGFSTVPVDDLLATVASSVRAITKTNGLAVVISKWDEAALAKHAGAVRVDVTGQLVDAFQPTELRRKSALAMEKIEPIPLKDADKIK